MLGIVGLIAFLTVLALSLVITRMATVALSLTGLSEEAAKFQARSAFTGTGFTTRESEQIVNHPVRRRIVMFLMVLRSAGLVTVVLSLILSFAGSAGSQETIYRLLRLAIGAGVLWLLASSKVATRLMNRAMERGLRRWTELDVRDYASLLRLTGDYTVMEIHLKQEDWLVGKTMRDCGLREEGVTVLGIVRENGNYVGVPKSATEIRAGDTLVVYGRANTLRKLDKRTRGAEGDRAHSDAVDDQQREMDRQDRQEQEHRRKAEAELKA